MKLNKNLVLLGMMGSGKSTIGFILAKKIKKKFIDIDKMIETKTGEKISDIFKNKGEEYFRKIEEKIVLDNLKLSNCVISLGGGSFLNQNSRNHILNKSISFWLNWSNQILLERLKNNKKRPLLLDLNEKEVSELINKRSKVYSKSNYKINCDGLTKLEIVNKIIKIYENKKNIS